ncbi:hypothetical protein VB151_17805 [Xanthomonas fragariae]|uniref:Uncharacterized protein n=1 Tax=Xanthomonas fragariae TaxID=48664 RepID=A0A1Y6HCU6_9XANT|nr:hypothetical protein [Xanthomonas fragariae]ENZ96627.1 hypothetical protein O1K_03706 [Xanthomonas fragariae LMG 25863]MBL9196933.1 hypothetical protein [Xanthomonas fragariae]MBL9221886.1 hypothetical protein [Xanthomonas fragariae]MDM7556159.1 hypothetical protein [Xanthomonas fragariae]MDM7559247.1 hypothetical protein [Xanthomonas fragariae]
MGPRSHGDSSDEVVTKKALRSAQLRERFGISLRRALQMMLMSQPSDAYAAIKLTSKGGDPTVHRHGKPLKNEPEMTDPKRIPWHRERSKSLPSTCTVIGDGSGKKAETPVKCIASGMLAATSDLCAASIGRHVQLLMSCT